MEQYITEGGNPLVGNVTVSGAKNVALDILAASIVTDEDVSINNLPGVRNINVLLEATQEIGAKVERIDRHTVKTNAGNIKEVSVNGEYIHKIRASYYFVGTLSGKCKSAQVPLPGSYNTDSRLIDQHTRGFGALGVEVVIECGAVIAYVIDLVANHIYLNVVSVGATVNIVMTATLAKEQTILESAAKEPHIVDMADFLNNTGANIEETGTDTIRIRDVDRLHGTEYSIIPDQIEAGTSMYAAAATRGDIMIKNTIPKHLEAISVKLIETRCEVVELDDTVRVVGKPSQRHTDIETLPYPGLPTDTQPQMSVALVLTSDISMVAGSVFEDCFKYVGELARMGSNMKVEGNVAMIDGVKHPMGVQVNTPDLRAGAALVIAGLAAEGYMVVDKVGYTQKGYKRFEDRLQGPGAMTEKVDSDRDLQKFELRIR